VEEMRNGYRILVETPKEYKSLGRNRPKLEDDKKWIMKNQI
jgi:hypothetical protein